MGDSGAPRTGRERIVTRGFFVFLVVAGLVATGAGVAASGVLGSSSELEARNENAGVAVTPERTVERGDLAGNSWEAVSFTDKNGDLCVNVTITTPLFPTAPGGVGGCFDKTTGGWNVATLGDYNTPEFIAFFSGVVPGAKAGEPVAVTFDNGDVIKTTIRDAEGLYFTIGKAGAFPTRVEFQKPGDQADTVIDVPRHTPPSS